MSNLLKQGQGQSGNLAAQLYASQKGKLFKSQDLVNEVNAMLSERNCLNIVVESPTEMEMISIDSLLVNEGGLDMGDMYTKANDSMGYRMQGDGNNYRPEIAEDRNKFLGSRESVVEELKNSIQFLKCPRSYKEIGVYLADCVDENGLIPEPEKVYNAYILLVKKERGELLFAEDVQSVHEFMKSNLNPPGIMARDQFESLEQKILRDKSWSVERDIALQLLTKHKSEITDSFKKNRKNQFEIDKEAFSQISIFKTLSGKDIASMVYGYISEHNKESFEGLSQAVQAKTKRDVDFIVTMVDNEYHVTKTGVPKVYANKQYMDEWLAFAQKGEAEKVHKMVKNEYNTLDYINKMLSSVKDVSEQVVKAILDTQKQAITSGDMNQLNVLRNIDLAEKFDVDQTVISNIINNKVVRMPNGEDLTLKHLMDRGVEYSGMGETLKVSKTQLRAFIKDKIQSEDISKPITDLEFRDSFKEAGYVISEPMVKRLREDIEIPGAAERMEFYKSHPKEELFEKETQETRSIGISMS